MTDLQKALNEAMEDLREGGEPLSFSIFNTIHNNILTVPIFAAVARIPQTSADPPHNIDNV